MAARQQNTNALIHIWLQYENGFGVNKDYKKAIFFFYEKAISLDYSEAYNYLGFLYFNGTGVHQEYEKASTNSNLKALLQL